MRVARSGVAVPILLAVLVSACGKPDSRRDLESLDKVLAEAGHNAADSAILPALRDEIVVDPTLAQQQNADPVRPATQPASGALPPDENAQSGGNRIAGEPLPLGALAARQKDRRTSNCAGALRYSPSWATRLPAGMGLYPGARVIEAAGANTATCALRAVTFATSAPMQKVVDFYATRLSAAGFTAAHRSDGAQHTLGGTRTRDDGAYVLFLTARRDGGTDVDLVANRGT